jgi:hypothetical protein
MQNHIGERIATLQNPSGIGLKEQQEDQKPTI